jgi:hypothetical protein
MHAIVMRVQKVQLQPIDSECHTMLISTPLFSTLGATVLLLLGCCSFDSVLPFLHNSLDWLQPWRAVRAVLGTKDDEVTVDQRLRSERCELNSVDGCAIDAPIVLHARMSNQNHHRVAHFR